MFFAIFQEVVQKQEKSPTRTLAGFPYVSFHWIFKKIWIWATFNYIYNISYERQNPECQMTP